jgi:DeoR/GlpR family transcriptional regulator of sugar metabolism
MVQLIDDTILADYIKASGKASISAICGHFNISESTARRSLARLGKKGQITRFHGGALWIRQQLTQFDKRLNDSREEKKLIGKKAASHIKEGASVFLLGGTTVAAMCPWLKNKKITLITNSLVVFDQLKDVSGISMVLLGGSYNREECECYGGITNNGLKMIHTDYIFMSCVGFSLNIGYTTNTFDSIEFYRLCISNTDNIVMLADSKKAGVAGLAVYAKIEEAHTFITDAGTPVTNIIEFRKRGVNVEIVTGE